MAIQFRAQATFDVSVDDLEAMRQSIKDPILDAALEQIATGVPPAEPEPVELLDNNFFLALAIAREIVTAGGRAVDGVSVGRVVTWLAPPETTA